MRRQSAEIHLVSIRNRGHVAVEETRSAGAWEKFNVAGARNDIRDPDGLLQIWGEVWTLTGFHGLDLK
jgi:hypothetical protein